MTRPVDALRNSILDSIAANQLVVMCGAGVSLSATGGDKRAGWAGMLAHGLDWCQDMGVNLPGTNGLERARRDLADGDLLSAAEKLQRGLRQYGQWEHFITATFSDLRLAHRELLEGIVALNMPIATTNYDTLIEKVAGQPPISWRSPTVFQKALADRSIGIAHLHGVWTDPDTVVLGSADYGALVSTEHTQALERALFLRSSVLFVGCGAGLEDPNFSVLRRYLLESFAGSPLTHYQLVTRAEDLADIPLLDRRESIKKVIYGDNFDDLPNYLAGLSQQVNTAAGGFATPGLGRSLGPKSQESLLSMPLLRGTTMIGPTLAQLWPDLVLDTRVRPLRSLRPAPTDTMAWLQESNHNHVVVIGGAGAGKSTLLRRLAIEGASWFGDLPIFLTADECLSLAPDSLPRDSTVIIDGLDEVNEDGLKHIAAFLRFIGKGRWWVSCRAEFFSRASPTRAILKGADEVLELQPLLPNQVTEFVDKYVQRTQHREVALVFEVWQRADDFLQLVTNPLNLIISILTASQEGQRGLAATPTSRYELYKMFYHHLIDYEADRTSLNGQEKRSVAKIHVRLARQIYSRRQRGQNFPSVPGETAQKTTWQAVSSILDVYRSTDRVVVRGFTHETFSEFVLAHDLVHSIIARSDKMTAPEIAFNNDVNGFVRDAFTSFTYADRERALTKLARAYQSSSSPRSREHLLYYIGRLGLKACPDILKQAYSEEASSLARRSAALGAIIYGDLETEQDYMNRLLLSSEEDLLNRSVQLVYFGDIMGDLHESTDIGGDWSRTRSALIERLSENDIRSQRLRWWDLRTLESFFQSRQETANPDEVTLLTYISEKFVDANKARMHAVRQLAKEIAER